MNTADRQLMQQVLRELEGIPFYRKYGVRISNAITALQKRLAQCDRCGKKLGGEGDIHTCTPDPIGDAQDKLIAEMAAQPEQEPVAWIDPADYATLENDGWCVVHANAFDGSHALHSTTPPAAQQIDEAYSAGYSNGMTEGYEAGKAYAAAQRTWVELTDGEVIALFEKYGHKTGELVGAVGDKLKERNT